MAKMGGTGVIDPWQKWVKLSMTKIDGTGVIDTVAKIVETLHDKNGWNLLWQKWVELVL